MVMVMVMMKLEQPGFGYHLMMMVVMMVITAQASHMCTRYASVVEEHPTHHAVQPVVTGPISSRMVLLRLPPTDAKRPESIGQLRLPMKSAVWPDITPAPQENLNCYYVCHLLVILLSSLF